MKVYIVVEWAIDYYYKVWGAFTSKEKARYFVEKLKKLSNITKPELLNGELCIDEVELDNDEAYIVECKRYDKNGNVVEEYYSRLTKDRDLYEKESNIYECKAVLLL